MKMLAFSKRCAKEILRDPLNILFGIGFPVVLLLLLSAMQANIPVELFAIESLAPGTAVFGLSFITLFSATLIARDRETSFLQRLYTTPLKSSDFILGYMLPLIPMAVFQTVVCYVVAAALGLKISADIFLAIVMTIPAAVFYIALGLLCGSVFNVKQVGGICGALLTNLSAWLSGIWFDIELLGETFVKIANIFPFIHAVEIERTVINGNFSAITEHLFPLIFYVVITATGAVALFLQKMKKQ
ncbi:MAG: ABC transporter permease [Oscillospiraceae bacterium]|nr:ABC transporter permease [Oscillospiraceae bacterium]